MKLGKKGSTLVVLGIPLVFGFVVFQNRNELGFLWEGRSPGQIMVPLLPGAVYIGYLLWSIFKASEPDQLP